MRHLRTGAPFLMAAQRDPHDSPAIQAFGIALQKMREAAGLTRTELAETLGYSPQFVGQIETARNVPSKTFAEDLDTYFKLGGLFLEFWKLIKGTRRLGTLPPGSAAYLELERSANTMRVFETRLIPALFQTDDYARALLGKVMNPDEIDETIRTQAERKALFDRKNPPHVFLVIDEVALRRKIGSPDTVREQLAHLLRLSERPEISIQVLPQDTDYYVAFSGSFTVLEFNGESDVVYLESAGHGTLIDRPPTVATCAMRFDLLRGHAYSITESRSIIQKALEAL
ncbi:helix-turn-helix domain-containing protein [Actinoallomurus sp. CA-142502]|uniref:helix-turn-helix domain-containing protein n=1 Tax=Actinoallomurus sp. CA-142502 TaxID=3239885 RepID=UPI003D92F7CF